MAYTIRLVILCLAILTGTAGAQEISKNAIKAEITVRLFSHVTWENDESSPTYNIAFLGSDPLFFEQLKVVALNRIINGRKLQLRPIKNLNKLADVHMLVVAGNPPLSLTEISLKARDSNTLIVSEVSGDKIHVMINFFQTDDSTLSFNINRSNMLLEKLTISDDILLLGGTELDVAELYREMESNLSEMLIELNSTQEKSSLANSALLNSRDKLEEIQAELLVTNQVLIKDRATIAQQKNTISARQEDLERASNSAAINQKKLLTQQAELEQRTEKIRRQQQAYARQLVC